MLDSAPVATPMTHTSHLSPDQGSPLDVDATSQYRRLLGCLIYLTNTRPDIAFVVHNLSQFIYAPTTHHQQDVSHLLRTSRAPLVKDYIFLILAHFTFVVLVTLTGQHVLPHANLSLDIPST